MMDKLNYESIEEELEELYRICEKQEKKLLERSDKLPSLDDIEKNMTLNFYEWEAEHETVESIVFDVIDALKKLGNFQERT
jgi:hypothetical protein